MKLVFNYSVPDKYTGDVFKEGNTYEFKEERAKEILSAINRDTGLPFAKEVKEKKIVKNKKAKKEDINEDAK